MFYEYDRVRTLVAKDNTPAGTIGVIVSFYSTGPACEVEVWGEDNYPFDVVTYKLSEIELVKAGPQKIACPFMR